jgi:small subunit ribosomal protein S6
MREYELMFVVDPRLTDEGTVALTDQYREMIQSAGGEVFKEESWGKRKLAYQINKLSEGSYTLFFVRSEEGTIFQEVEQRMRQNEDVLRYLTVRTDAGRLRHRAPREEKAAEAGAAEAAASDAKEAS